VTLPYEISLESPSFIIRVWGQSVVCVHTYSESDNALLRYGHLKFFDNVWIGPEIGRSSVFGRSFVNIHTTSYTDLIVLFRYIRNVAREE